MPSFAEIASKIRHSSLLQHSDWLWNGLRKPYHYLLNFKNKGVEVKVNDSFSYRIPPQYYHVGLEDYEKVNIECLVGWIRRNPDCYVLDLGCSIGIMSVVSLYASETAKVMGVDSDLSSLKATLRMCRYASGDRISLIYGLISEQSTVKRSIAEAIAQTSENLAVATVTGDPGTTRYVNIDHAGKDAIFYSLDDLFEAEKITRPILLKCDIEGAELLALKGAEKFISTNRPDILLSVHPGILPVFGGSVEQVKAFLIAMDYTIEIIAVDHEEHWWCTPINK